MTKDEIITMLERQLMLAYKEIEELEDKLARRWKKKDTRPAAGPKAWVKTPDTTPRRRVLTPAESRARNK